MRIVARVVGLAALCGAAWGQTAVGAVTNADFVRQAYQDLLGRAPSGGEVATWETYLGTHTRQQTALAIDTTLEFYGIVVNDLYGLLLHRAASPGDKTALTGAITGGATIEQVEASIAGSTEYFANRAGGTNAGYISALIDDLLGRSATPTELTVFGGQLTGGSTRTDLAAAILASTEYQTDLVSGYYQKYLHRSAGTPEVNGFVSQLQLGTRDEVVISQIIGSDEYFNNIVPVPEPATLSIGAFGALALLVRRRRMGGS